MRRSIWFSLVAVLASVACEMPVESIDTTVVMTADWTPPAGPFNLGATVPGQPAVLLVDSRGQPRSGVPVAFLPLVPPLTSFPVIDTTDAGGRAEMPTPWVLGTRTGVHRVMVYVPSGQSNDPVVFSVQVQPGPVALFDLSVGADSAFSRGDSITATLNVRDAAGNVTTPTNPVVLTSSDTSVLRVVSGLRSVAVGSGTVTLRATAGTNRDSVRLLVGVGAPTVQRAGYPFYDVVTLSIGHDRTLYAADNSTDVRRFSLTTLDSLSSLVTDVELREVRLRPGTTELWMHSTNMNRTAVRSSVDGSLLYESTTDGARLSMAASGNFVILSGGISAARLFTPGSPPTSVFLPAGPLQSVGVTIAAGDSALYLASSGALVYRLSLPDGAETARTNVGLEATGLAHNPSAPRLYVAIPDFGVRSLNATSLGTERTAQWSGGALDVALTADRKYVIATGGSQVRVLDAVTLFVYQTINIPGAKRVVVDQLTGDVWIGGASDLTITRLRLAAP
jgi:hypothetical protein